MINSVGVKTSRHDGYIMKKERQLVWDPLNNNASLAVVPHCMSLSLHIQTNIKCCASEVDVHITCCFTKPFVMSPKGSYHIMFGSRGTNRLKSLQAC